jgi:hypothetical protein
LEQDTGSGELADEAGVGVDGLDLFGQLLLYFGWFHRDVVAFTGQQAKYRHLVVLISVELELGLVLTVWDDALVQFRNLKRRPHSLGVGLLENLHQYVD